MLYSRTHRATRMLRLAVLTFATASTVALLPAVASHAAVSNTTHPIPGTGSSGVTVVCAPHPGYACTGGGYSGQNTGWPGARYAAAASVNTYGRHNCTLYAAYRLAANGLADPGWNDDAHAWDTRAASGGALVDQTPVTGAIAQWNSGYGHVAYVEVVHPDYIEITDDSYGSNVTRRLRIARTSPTWPDNFIHLRDVGTGGHLRQFYVADGSWTAFDLSSATGVSVAGSPASGAGGLWARDTNGQLRQFYVAGGWTAFNASAATGV
ncbi:CHAP domain-containing protein, partial [Catellatospora methionotrophica]|uniref:CHAP domain-containing protein n=1 Tax=Catellatospora methionotrophica TaxID=121620 RepID=UPI0033F0A497